MLRVALGRARPETEWNDKISGLEFNSNSGGGAEAVSADSSRSHGTGGGFGTNAILTVPRTHLEHEFDHRARDGISNEVSVRGKEN
jgi:hypothetical protein